MVHAAIVLLLLGAIGIGGFGTTSEARLAVGDSMQAGDYRLELLGTSQTRGANAQEIRARLAVSRDGESARDAGGGQEPLLRRAADLE